MISWRNSIEVGNFFKLLKAWGAWAVFVLLIILVVRADTWTDTGTGRTWYYEVYDGEACIACDSNFNPSVTPPPEGDLVIPESLDGFPVTSIGGFSLMNYGAITSVKIPAGVRSIDWCAFCNCGALASVEMPYGLTFIGDEAFSGCWSLSGLTIPESVWYIGRAAFSRSGLTSLAIPEGIAQIEAETFYECGGLNAVDIPASVMSIGEYAFYGCYGLNNLTIPDSVAFIGEGAFDGCCSITNLALSQYVLEQGLANVFPESLASLETVTILDGATVVPSGAFAGCTSLRHVTIPSSVTSVAANAFAGCKGIMSVTVPQRVLDKGLRNVFPEAYRSIESATILDGATRVSDSAFRNCSGLVRVSIPSGVTSIGNHAFRDCSSLERVEMPNGVASIGSYAFAGCASLSRVTIPDGVVNIGSYAFRDCTSLTEVSIPSSVTSIGASAFYGCTGIKSVAVSQTVLAKRVKSLFPNACTSIKYITVLEGAKSIPANAFVGCAGLTSVTIPSSVTTIKARAFAGCRGIADVAVSQSVLDLGLRNVFSDAYRSIEHVTILDGATSVPANAFVGCTGLKSVDIPASVTTIKVGAFAGCNGITDVVVSQPVLDRGLRNVFPNAYASIRNVTIIDGATSIPANAFAGCTGLKSVEIPASVTAIAEGEFASCEDITSVAVSQPVLDRGLWNVFPTAYASIEHVTILGGATNIEDRAFSGCAGLASVSMPNDVTRIGDYAFYGCTGLASLSIPGSVIAIGRCAFADCRGLADLTLSEGLTSIDDDAFRGCAGLTSVVVPESVGSMGRCVFDRCTGLTSVTLPSGMWWIGDAMFWGCTSLESVTIPNEARDIGWETFYGCSGLTSVELPDHVETIGERAFSGCTGLTNLTIPASVTWIGADAFADCTGLTDVSVPQAVFDAGFDSVFPGCTWLRRVVLQDGVVNIGDYAFSCQYDLESVTIPEGVTSIGAGAFQCCYSLSEVALPESLTSIGSWAFAMSGVYSVSIPSGVTSVASDAFAGSAVAEFIVAADNPCYKSVSGLLLTKDGKTLVCGVNGDVAIPNCVTRIEDMAFGGCGNLSSVTIPHNVTNIGNYAFSWCGALESVSLPDGVTRIGDGAFSECCCLESVAIPGSVTSIGDNAFYSCYEIRRVSIPQLVLDMGLQNVFPDSYDMIEHVTILDGATSIPANAFAGCVGLKSVEIPASITTIAEGAFANCCNVKNVVVPQSVLDRGFRNVFPDSYQTIEHVTILDGATSIPANAFTECFGLKSVLIPDGVTSIGNDAFFLCTRLASVTIPSSVTRWGVGAFFGCDGLESVVIPPSVLDVGLESVFNSGEWAPRRVEIMEGVVRIEDYAFANCSGLTSVIIPDSVTSIGEDAFYGCSGLTSMTIPDSVTSVGDRAFANCSGLTSVTIPDSVTSIGRFAFVDCFNLAEVVLGEGVENIEDGAFSYCISLKRITIPYRVFNIGCSAFEGCAGLQSVTVEGRPWIEDYAFCGCANLSELILHGGFERVGNYAFWGCASLTGVMLYGDVSSIGDYAFYGCANLAEVKLYGFVGSIGEYAFYGCTNLSDVMLDGGVWSIGDYAFYNCPALTFVNVPYYCQIGYMAFDSRAVWDEFAAKIGNLDPFSYPEGSTNTVLEHLFYSGTTNGVFAYPVSTVDTAVLKISVWGEGMGRLYIGDYVVPLVAPPLTHNGYAVGTLLIPVRRGDHLDYWFDKPEGLEVSFSSDDYFTGWYDWIAFPASALDADGDGLADARDPEPTVYGGDFYGVANSLPEDANPDAYYWLDLSVTGLLDVAAIRVTCDGPSDLGDHLVIARAGQACHIPLLVGATYAVESDLPIKGASASSECAEIVKDAANRLTVSLPLQISFEPVSAQGGAAGYVAHTFPIDVGPRITEISGGCCSCEPGGAGFSWSCCDGCQCGGGWHDLWVNALWGGYSRCFLCQGQCPCIGEVEPEPQCPISISIPDTMFPNDDADTYEEPFPRNSDSDCGQQMTADDDLARCSVSLESTEPLTGAIRLYSPTPRKAYAYCGNLEGSLETGLRYPEGIDSYRDWRVEDCQERTISWALDASSISSYNGMSVRAEWIPDEGEKVSVSSKFTIARVVAEPICTETVNVVENGVSHTLVVNPCGVEVGRDAYFRVEVKPADYPDEKITWSPAEGCAGTVEFIGPSGSRNEGKGRSVRVRGKTPGKVKLEVSVGSCPSDKPTFEFYVVEKKVRHISVWIAAEDSGKNQVCREDKVREMLPTVNDVFSQIGMTFVIDSVNVLSNKMAKSPYYYEESANGVPVSERDNLTFNELVGSVSANDIKCIFVDKFEEESEKGTRAATLKGTGIVMTSVADALTLAHELGHELGAEDIYVSKGDFDVFGEVFWCDCVSEDDWSNGCYKGGSGYYRRDGENINCGEIIKRLLMHGHSSGDPARGLDMTVGPVYGVRKVDEKLCEKDKAFVGFRTIIEGRIE